MMDLKAFLARSQVADLPERHCQFHAGRTDDRGLLVFCGDPVKEGYSYCPEHHRKVYQRVSAMKAPPVVVEVATETTEVAMPEIEREAA
jgi:hypothetical protein